MIGTVRGLFLAVPLLALAAQIPEHRQPLRDWPQFGWDVASSSASQAEAGISAATLPALVRRQVTLDGTVDASAIYLHSANIKGAAHDAFFVTTTYGNTLAIDADSGSVLWEFTPPNIASWAGSAQITNSTPVADPDRQSIYATAPDGVVRKLAMSDGHAIWSTVVTLLPSREKMDSPLKVFNGRVIAVTGGYVGDAPPYQGHVAILDAQSGALQHVWNSLCSDRTGLLTPSSCASTRSAIWGRAGAVIDASTGNIFVATGNGPYNGATDWGDALIELTPDATQVLANYTPTDNTSLNGSDLDLGSTSPVLLAPGILAQGGKDDLIRLVGMSAISGTAAHSGGELQMLSTPSKSMLFTAPAVWQVQNQTWLFAADGGGTAGWTYANGALTQVWVNQNGGTSPVVAGGLLYVYNPGGSLRVYDPATGAQLANLTCGGGHWNSPIVVDGRIALPEGNANSHTNTGVLNIWSAARRKGRTP